MSAYKKIQCDIVDKETLLEALKILGFDPSVHEFPMHLTGYLGDQRNEMIRNKHHHLAGGSLHADVPRPFSTRALGRN